MGDPPSGAAARRAADRDGGDRAGRGAVLGDAGAHPVQAAADVVVATVLVAVLPRHGRTRLWAPALLLPATWLAGRGLAVLAALLG